MTNFNIPKSQRTNQVCTLQKEGEASHGSPVQPNQAPWHSTVRRKRNKASINELNPKLDLNTE